MNNETFGMTIQYAICLHFEIENDISIDRIDYKLLDSFIESQVVSKIFKSKPSPIEYLTSSKKFTSPFIRKCPHNFLLENEESFSIKSFRGKNKMFAPKVIGQSSWRVFNHFFADIVDYNIDRNNFKKFCLENISEILPTIIDYALVSDYNCWFYPKDNHYSFEIIQRADLPDLTFNKSNFSFTKNNIKEWVESNTVKYKGQSIIELQLHKNRNYKIRFQRDNFPKLLEEEKRINNSMLGDTAELAICRVFELDPGNDNERLLKNSDKTILGNLINHYKKNQKYLFPLKPIKYEGTGKRKRGGQSKSGIDFKLENRSTLSVKTNKSKSFKVCPPEIGQPSPKTFDLHFSKKGWYKEGMNEEKFKQIVRDKYILVLLLKEYVKFLNECDFILWSFYKDNANIKSQLITKSDLNNFSFDPNLIHYTNDFIDSKGVTIHYPKGTPLGEFQLHSARNSLKFRFNFGNLLSIK